MAINVVQPVFREIPVAGAVPQLSLTRRDRELQMEEGKPPMEVASAEQDAVRWQKNEDLREKWKKRQEQRNARPKEAQGGESGDARCDTTEGGEDARLMQTQPMQESMESLEEESTGTLFDDRS